MKNKKETMEEKILNCILEALFEELGCANADAVIERLNSLFKKYQIPYKFHESDITDEFKVIKERHDKS